MIIKINLPEVLTVRYFKNVFFVLVFLSFLVFMITGESRGQVPMTLNYQGYLTDGTGQPVNGGKEIVFSFYDVQLGGTAFWTEPQTVNVNAGRFSVVLGRNTPINPSHFSGETWIGVRVVPDTEMPRQKFTSVAYALHAGNVATAVPTGVIVMWSGSAAGIPNGWALCNGTNGTPDLRDRFILGSGETYPVGSSGGSTTKNLSHTHTGPSHTHIVNSHNHKGSSSGGDLRAAIGIVGSDDKLGMIDATPGNPLNGSLPGPTRVSDMNAPGTFQSWQNWVQVYGYTSSESPETSNNGGGNTGANGNIDQDIMPPYYALCFIMKL